MSKTSAYFSTLVNGKDGPEKRFQLPFGRLVFGPYLVFANHFRVFAAAGAIYALLASLVYLLSGQALFCSFSNFTGTEICAQSLALYIGARVVGFFLVSAFCVRYYQAVWQGRKLSWRWLLMPKITDLYAFGAGIVFILLNAVSGLSWYLLAVRIPNPDWRIELTYFAVVALGFLVPFVLLRFYSLFADVWGRQKPENLADIWDGTKGSGLKLIVGVALLFFIFTFALLAVSSNFALTAGNNAWYTIFGAEFLYNLVLLIAVSFFINFCGLLKFYLNEGMDNEKTQKH